MKRHLIKLSISLGALILMGMVLACATRFEPQTATVLVPYPEDFPQADVILECGASNIIADATGAELLEGSITYNTAGLDPVVLVQGNNVRVSQKGTDGIATADIVNNWVLHFGTEMPLSLKINAGAYIGQWELGGIPLTNLAINQGAAQSVFSFASPNPVVMDFLDINTGASSIQLLKLANANFERLTYKGGAGSLNADFTGTLMRNSVVDINTAVTSVIVTVPGETPARIDVSGGAYDVIADEGFIKIDGDYVTPGWADHDEPSLEVNINIVGGSLTLELE